MVVKRCVCGHSNVVGVLVFSVGQADPISPSDETICADVFQAALAFMENEKSDLIGKFMINGESHGPVHYPQD